MPALFGFILIAIAIFFAASMLIPTVAGIASTLLIGRAGKLDDEEKGKLAYYYYFLTGACFGAYLAAHAESGMGAFFSFLLGVVIWPFPVSMMLLGMSTEGMGGLFASLILGYVLTQMVAVLMILKKADDETNLS